MKSTFLIIILLFPLLTSCLFSDSNKEREIKRISNSPDSLNYAIIIKENGKYYLELFDADSLQLLDTFIVSEGYHEAIIKMNWKKDSIQLIVDADFGDNIQQIAFPFQNSRYKTIIIQITF